MTPTDVLLVYAVHTSTVLSEPRGNGNSS